MRGIGWLLFALVGAFPASGQQAEDWIERGHRAARADRHAEAIAAYEQAIALSPALRPQLLAPLGRQYLWSDRPGRAAALLGEYLRAHDDCDVRLDHALALAWSDRLESAAEVLERIGDGCPELASAARLRLALVRRWQDRPGSAEALYRELAAAGDATGREARLGLAHVALLRGYDRAALAAFEAATDAALTPAELLTALEGAAIASARLGEHHRASALLERAASSSSLSRDGRELRLTLGAIDRLRVAPQVRSFHDADGTSSRLFGAAASMGWNARGRGGLEASHTTLSHADSTVRLARLSLSSEYRWSPLLAGRAELGAVRVTPGGWTPATGELGVVITPSDRLRADLAAARLLVSDHPRALRERLHGDFLSTGADWRATDHLTLVGALDATRWSAGNRRLRVRANARWQLEGTPRITVEMPFLVQRYDRPMPFPFFSPREYIEVGPGVTVYRRIGRWWNMSAHARSGAQRESGRSWDPFGTLRASAWTDAPSGWSGRATVSWSNSDLASSGSFQRTAVEVGVTRVF